MTHCIFVPDYHLQKLDEERRAAKRKKPNKRVPRALQREYARKKAARDREERRQLQLLHWEKRRDENRRRHPQLMRRLESAEFREWFEQVTGEPFDESVLGEPTLGSAHDLVHHATLLLDERQEKEEAWASKLKMYQETINDPTLPGRYRRRVAMKLCTPVWVDVEEIRTIYAERDHKNKLAGYSKYEVDHVVPVLGSNVCGLHVHQNLRVISKEDNRRKSNKLLEDLEELM